MVGLIGRKLGGHNIGAVARHFSRDPVAITQGVKKVEAELREESDFKQAIEKIEKTLTKKREKKYLCSGPVHFIAIFRNSPFNQTHKKSLHLATDPHRRTRTGNRGPVQGSNWRQ